MKMRKGVILKNPVFFVFLLITVCSILVLFISILKLPDITPKNTAVSSSKNEKIGKFGEMIIEMLPKDLGFTVFLPTEKAFERDLKLHWNESNSSLVGDDDDDTYAILSRVMGFSAVPRMIYSDDLLNGKEINYDSLCGYVLYISKRDCCSSDGGLMVNRVRSEEVNLKIGEKLVVHLMDGVVMDSEFQQSFKTDDDESDQD